MPDYLGQGTPLGKVQITPRGEYQANTTYYKLDCVSYNGNSYLFTAPSGQASPAVNSNVWQLLASQGAVGPSGPTGNFGDAAASISILASGEDAYINITVDHDSPAYAKKFIFDFGIPAGPTGVESVTASASWGASGQPSVTASLVDQNLDLKFFIPARDSSIDIISVDNIQPSGYNIDLKAIRYEEGWTFSSDVAINRELQGRARSILNAQVAGDYISTAGGTMLDDFNIKSNNINGTGTFDQVGKNISFIDANASTIAHIFPEYKGNSEIQSFSIAACRNIDDTTYENSLTLGIDNNGNSVISLSSVDAWRNALTIIPGTTLPVVDVMGGATGDAVSFARANHAHPLNISDNAPPHDTADGSAGSSTAYAKADHIHILNYSTNEPAKDSAVGFYGTLNAYALSDHAHPINVSTASALGGTAYGSAGTGLEYARWDHQHPLNISSTPAADLAASSSPGQSTYYARLDHVHRLPTAAQVGAAGAEVWQSVPSYKTISVTGSWSGSDPYTVSLSSSGIQNYSANTIFDLRPNGTLIQNMVNADVTALYIENNYPTINLCAVGSNALTLSNTSISFVYYNSR